MLCVSILRRHIFDACYVLNLDSRPDRWKHVQRQIARASIPSFLLPPATVTRVSGVDGTKLDLPALHKDGFLTDLGFARLQLPLSEKLFGMDLTPGAVGCGMGHRSIWERIVKCGHTRALVLEDDVEFHHKFARLLPTLWERVPSDWGIVHLGGLDLLARGKPPRPFLAQGVRLAYEGHRELTAYVLHHRAAQRCLELSAPMTWQIDTHIHSILGEDVAAEDRYIADPKAYVFQPALAIQLTTLGTNVQKQLSSNPTLEDAARRMREFVGGETSVR